MSDEIRITRDIDDDDREDIQQAIRDRQEERLDFIEDQLDEHDDD